MLVLDSLAFQRFPKTDLRVYPYGSSSPITVQGTFDTHLPSGATVCLPLACFVVVENANAGSLLRKFTAITPSLLRHVEQLAMQYSSLFKGVGRLKNCQLKIHTDPNVTPVAQPLHRIPFHIWKDTLPGSRTGHHRRCWGTNPMGLPLSNGS